MNDDLDPKLDVLFAAVRATPADGHVSRLEFGFETRLAARLREENGASLFAWAWRLCPFFAALALAAAWWSHTTDRAEVYSEIAADVSPANEELLAYMTGDRQ